MQACQRLFAVRGAVLFALCIFALFAAYPLIIGAEGMEADAQCIPADPDPCICQPKFVPKKGCTGAPNKFMCPCVDMTSGYATVGKCVATNKCKGETGGGKPLDQGLSKLGEMLGKLLEKLGEKKGGGGDQPPQNPNQQGLPPGTQCTQYYQVSEPSTDPCAVYTPGLTGNTGTCSLTDQLLGGCNNNNNNGGGGSGGGEGGGGGSGGGGEGGGGSKTDNTNATLTVEETSGEAPLIVAFTVADISTTCERSAVILDFGDNTSPVTVFQATATCAANSPKTITHTYSSPGSYQAELTNENTQRSLATLAITALPAGTEELPDVTSATLTAEPQNGTAPLIVSLIVTDTSPSCKRAAIRLDFGDGSDPATALTAASSCDAPKKRIGTHTYAEPGTYEAYITNADTGDKLQSLAIIVSPVDSGGEEGGEEGGGEEGGGETTGSPWSGRTVYLMPNGAYGDIRLLGEGATFIAGTRDEQNKTEVAGFLGTTGSGIQPTGIVANLCKSRPWSSNFLSFIVPPSFFDSLCTWRGYQVGEPPAPPAQVTQDPKVNVTQTPPRPVKKPATTPPVKSEMPEIPSRVDIWAVPAAVPLGSRTSIFWNTQGVTNCTETSPDGSFHQTTLSGGASTVPLTGPTTFTISCLNSKGEPVTDFVTVTIAI